MHVTDILWLRSKGKIPAAILGPIRAYSINSEVIKSVRLQAIDDMVMVSMWALSYKGVRILVPAQPNPYLDESLKSLFLAHLDALEKYRHFKVKPIQ